MSVKISPTDSYIKAFLALKPSITIYNYNELSPALMKKLIDNREPFICEGEWWETSSDEVANPTHYELRTLEAPPRRSAFEVILRFGRKA